MSISRRSLVTTAATLPALAVPALAADHGGDDAELLALEHEIDRIYSEAETFYEERIAPLDEGQWEAMCRSTDEALRFGRETGRDSLCNEHIALIAQTDALNEKMWSMVPRSEVGRRAKLRVFFQHIAGKRWLGPDVDLDYDMECARKLLFEYGGFDPNKRRIFEAENCGRADDDGDAA